MNAEAEAGWILLSVIAVGGLAYLLTVQYLDWKQSRKFWREIHMSAGQAVRENKRRGA